jgi:hypothetical protein
MVTKCCSAIQLPKLNQNVIGTADGSLTAVPRKDFRTSLSQDNS